MKPVSPSSLPSQIVYAIRSALSTDDYEELSAMNFFYNFLDNYSAQEKNLREEEYNLIIEPPLEWEVSLRESIGLDSADCYQILELNIYILYRNFTQVKEFYTPTISDLTPAELGYVYHKIDMTIFDSCFSILQLLFKAINEFSNHLEFKITEVPVSLIMPGITSKEEYGIHTKVKVKWF
jgi:hypothetical protein